MVQIIFVTVKIRQKIRVVTTSIDKWTQVGALYTDIFLEFSIALAKTENWFPYK